MEFGEITDEGIAELRARIGKTIRTALFGGYNTEVTFDTLRHFVDGIGELNPLFRDAEVGRRSGYARQPAPPSFLFSIHPGFILQGLPGVHSLNGGHEWEFCMPPMMGDHISADPRLVDVVERQSRWAGRVVYQYNETRYIRGDGQQMGKVRHWSIRGSRAEARKRKKFDEPAYQYSDDELKAIDDAYLNERYRGAEPRYWEDVEVGQEVDAIVRGPFSMSDLIAYYAGALGAKAHGVAMAQFRKHPGWAIRDPQTGAPVEPVRAHEDPALAQLAGVGKPYDIGGQRCSWGISSLDNWIGDAGFLTYYYSENRFPVYVGDTVWLGGRVTRKWMADDEAVVEIETWGKNQRDQNVLPGTARCSLPTKASPLTPVKRRMTPDRVPA